MNERACEVTSIDFDKYRVVIKWKIRGFWSDGPVSLICNKNPLDSDLLCTVGVHYSCGGEDGTQTSIECAENKIAALREAVRWAKRIEKRLSDGKDALTKSEKEESVWLARKREATVIEGGK
jgi:hypothetical protein